MAHAEALFLVNYQKAKVLKLYIFAEQLVCTHHNVHAALLKAFKYSCLLLGSLKAGQQLHPYREAVKAGGYGAVMLLGKYSGGHQYSHLLAVHDRLECGTESHLGLAVAHVAAEQTVHHLVAFHVRLYLFYAGKLIRRFVVWEAVLQLFLPGCIRGKLKALALLPLAVQAHKVKGKALYAFLCSGYRLLPLAAAQLGQALSFLLAADVFLYSVQLIRGDIQLISAGIHKMQIVLLHAPHVEGLHPYKATYAVELMYHKVANRKLAEHKLRLAALFLLGFAVFRAVQLAFAYYRKGKLRILKAPVYLALYYQRLAGNYLSVQRLLYGDYHVKVQQSVLQSLCMAARVYQHGGFTLLPRGDIIAKQLFPAYVFGYRSGLKFEYALWPYQPVGTGEGEEHCGTLCIKPLYGVQRGYGKVCLLRLSLA